jgi:hypothetical protein
MSFSHTLLEELQLPSGIATLGEERNRLWRYEHHQAIFVQRWERRCKVLFARQTSKGAKRSYCPAQPLHARAKALAAANRWPVPTLDVAFALAHSFLRGIWAGRHRTRPTLEHAQEHQIAGLLVHRSHAGSIGRRHYRPYRCFRYRSHWEWLADCSTVTATNAGSIKAEPFSDYNLLYHAFACRAKSATQNQRRLSGRPVGRIRYHTAERSERDCSED